MHRSLATLRVWLALVVLTVVQAAHAAQPEYRGALVMDAANGQVIFEDQADRANPPASVAKLMTFLVVHDCLRAGTLTLNTPITITREDAGMGGTQVWLEAGEAFTVEDLLYALLIQSANDAAHALARAAYGSVPAFVSEMNRRAQSLGMARTTFRTPHGLPPRSRKASDSDMTTARDLALLSRELLLHTDVITYSSVRERTFRPGQPPPREVIMRSHNHLLAKVRGADGLKTGYTSAAGFCLAATAEREGRRLIVVVVGSPDAKSRDIKVAELVERFFAKGTDLAVFQRADESPFIQPSASAAGGTSPAASPSTPPAAESLPTVRFPRPRS
jgi:D-alanyl-D-alanine carboxypeptidase